MNNQEIYDAVLREVMQEPEWDGLTILPHEEFWRDHQPWLEQNGYQLRPRYSPGWVASWTDHRYYEHQDGLPSTTDQVLDATRLSDGEMVLLKRIRRKVHPYEVEITQSFSKEPMKSHPHNHCIPLFDVLDVPDGDDTSIIVLPLLRLFDDPSFQTIGEVVEFIRQIFEGLQFMHEAHVAHRDCGGANIMMDPRPMYPDMYHPRSTFKTRDGNGWARHYTRTRRPVKYYLIDFGLSRRYAADDVSPLEVPIRGGDKSVPEFRSDEPCNPFPTDIYYVGNMIRENFLQKPKGFAGFEFMSSLVNDMVQDDPSKRPTIDQVVARFDQLIHSLSWWTLHTRLPEDNETRSDRVFRGIRHAFRTTTHLLTLRSALPRPRSDPPHTFTF